MLVCRDCAGIYQVPIVKESEIGPCTFCGQFRQVHKSLTSKCDDCPCKTKYGCNSPVSWCIFNDPPEEPPEIADEPFEDWSIAEIIWHETPTD